MKYITYNDYELSKLSLGTVQFGLDYGVNNELGKPSQDNVNKIVEYVVSKGVNFLDTAQSYGNSEEVVGIASKPFDSLNIISKVKSEVFEKNLMNSVEISLKKLNVKSIFALLLHDSKLLANWKSEKNLKIQNLKNKKLIKYFGVSIYTKEDFELALNIDSINIIQIPYNIFDQRAIKESWFKRAKEKNKLLFIRSVYLQGLLLMNKDDASNKINNVGNYLDKLDYYCNKLKISRNELALSFVNTTCEESIILFGCDTLSQAKENIDIFNNIKAIDKESLNELEKDFNNIDESIYNPGKWCKN